MKPIKIVMVIGIVLIAVLFIITLNSDNERKLENFKINKKLSIDKIIYT